MIPYDMRYGNYRTPTFDEVFAEDYPIGTSSAASFVASRIPEILPTTLVSDTELTTIYYLLYGAYGNSHIAFTDVFQFRVRLFSLIASYGPAAIKEMEIQSKLKALNLESGDLFMSTLDIRNHAANPESAPATDAMTALTYIDGQNVSGKKRGKLEAYAMLSGLLDANIYENFVHKFSILFKKIVAAPKPLYFESEDYDADEE